MKLPVSDHHMSLYLQLLIVNLAITHLLFTLSSEPTAKCAEAITNYMDALSTGNAPAASSGAAAQKIGGYLDNLASGGSNRAGGSGIQNYLSAIGSSTAIKGSASAVKSYLDAMSSGATAAPAAPAVKSYLDNVSSGATSTPTSGSGIASYLSALGNTNVLSGGGGIRSHVDTLASGTQLSGGGVKGYLDNVGGAVAAAYASATKQASSIPGTPSTKIDTQVSHNGLQTTITITSVTTVVIDDA